MGKVKVSMRLYKMHDLDLITFIETHKLNYRKAVYCSLSAFIKGEVFLIKIPPKRDASKGESKKIYRFDLLLDSKKDKDMIEFLNKIKEGKRNSFLKNLLRLYLCNPISDQYLENEEDEVFFSQKFNIFRVGKRIANLDEDYKNRNLIPEIKEKVIQDNSKTKNTKVIGKLLEPEKTEIDKEEVYKKSEKVEEDSIKEDNESVIDLFSSLLE